MSVAPPAVASISGNSLLSKIGNTPLLRLSILESGLPGVEIYGKAEYFNPGGSVKDRPALNMLLDGINTGRLAPGKTILDATSGNTGIAYAMIGAALGYPVKLCLPQNASIERKRILRAYGAHLVITDPGEGTDGAIRRCKQIYQSEPEAYFYPNQYDNPANWQAHHNTTAPEIIRQTDGRITHFVAGLGTSGSFVGITRRFRRELPGVRCISMQPATGFHGLEGLKHMPTAIVPGIYDPDLADENLWVETEGAHAMVRRAARTAGLLVGISSGANMVAARRIGERLAASGQKGVIVTILCDAADKYLSEEFWNDPD